MECGRIGQKYIDSILSQITVSPSRVGCKVGLPLLELNGDQIYVYVQESEGKFIVHDGGHVSGLLFDVGPSGAALSDKRAIDELIRNSGLQSDDERGIVFTVADDKSMTYWMSEVGRVIAVVSSIIPINLPPTRRPRRFGKRVANALGEKLVEEGLMGAIRPGTNVKGVTERNVHVDFSYTVPSSPIQQERTIYILTMDLDVRDPISVANRGIVAATDLAGIEIEPVVRMVYSTGTANGKTEPARRLIQAAGKRHILEDYSWDVEQEQRGFLEKIEQELGALLQL